MSKFNNKKTVVDGFTFDSKKEAARWCELKLLGRAGEITGLLRQVSFELIPKCGKNRAVKYIADFVYCENGETIVEDVKGFRTDVYKLKKRMMLDKHSIEIREV